MSDEVGALPLASWDPRGRGRPLLCVHGFGHDRSVWAALAEGLDPALRPIAVDLRGHGRSDWSPQGDYDVRAIAGDLPVTLDRLELPRVSVIAHSLGGQAAILFAAAHPERVESLVLVDTGPALALEAMLEIGRSFGRGPGSFETVDAYHRHLLRLHPLADPGTIAGLARSMLVRRLDGRFEPRLDPAVLSGGSLGLEVREALLWEALGRLGCPTLVVRGGLSAVLAEPVARRMVEETLADGRLERLASAGHGVMLDDAPGLSACVDRFLAA